MPPPPDEADAARGYNLGPTGMGAKINIDTDKAQASVDAMAQSMRDLQKSLQDFGNNAYIISGKINQHLNSIGTTALKVAQQISGVGAALSGVGGGGGGNGGGPPRSPSSNISSPGGGSGGGAAWVNSASNAIARVANKELGPGIGLGTFLGDSTGDGAKGFLKDALLSPLRWMRDRVNTNRDTTMLSSGVLNMAAIQQGTTTDKMMSTIARFPGNVLGTPQDLLSLFSGAGSLGASYNFGGQTGGQGVRAAGMFKGIREMQMLNPLASVGGEGGLMSTLGGYAADTRAQQKSMMYTGGAMGMIASGGRQKSLSEWADSIMRWFEGLRPGAKRNTPFNHGELMAQYFPGSNIDAWFDMNAVPQAMRDYWWTYALGKVSKSVTFGAGGEMEIGGNAQNVAYQRLRSSSELTRTEFSLGAKMAPQYAMREGSNRWFNELMGQVQEKIIPAVGQGPLGWIQYLPDSLEDLMMAMTERGATSLFGGRGDVGDIGDSYGEYGGTGLGGLHPDMQSKVGRMMKANPRLRINSGLRDTGLQQRLKAKGHNRVSGKPSAHTRGMAADLGPRSQYSWIAKNARKFGLASGKGHGEPWHVGMPGDISGVGDIFDDFLSAGKGVTSSPEGMGGFVTKMLDIMTGLLGKLIGGEGPSTDVWGSTPDELYAKLAGGGGARTIGLPSSGSSASFDPDAGIWGGIDSLLLPGGVGGAAGAILGAGGGGGIDAVYGAPALPGTPGAGKAAATALFNAGFRNRKDLETITAISWRESKWNPLSRNPHTSDRGLMQINMSAHKKTMQEMGYTEADLMDIQKNANIAHRLWQSGGGNYAAFQQLWGFSENSPYSVPVKNRPGWDKNGDPLGRTQGSNAPAIVEAAGLPVIGDIDASVGYPNRREATIIQFNNQFTIGGGVSGNGGGSNGGIDLRRTVSQIADHLEDEMNRRLKRSA